MVSAVRVDEDRDAAVRVELDELDESARGSEAERGKKEGEGNRAVGTERACGHREGTRSVAYPVLLLLITPHVDLESAN